MDSSDRPRGSGGYDMTELTNTLMEDDEPGVDVDFIPLDLSCSPVSVDRDSELIQAFLDQEKIRIMGMDTPPPIFAFNEAPLPPEILAVITRKEWTQPTAIQKVAIPIVLKGLDMIGIARTGSGKTGAFAIPAVLHCRRNKDTDEKGPFAVMVCPTRELACQCNDVVKDFANAMNLDTVLVMGGERNRREQIMACQKHPDIVIATPGRLMDLVKERSVDLSRVSFVVIDEADRMLDMGFEGQLRAIVKRCQTGKQTLMWSATWPKEVRDLSKEFLKKDEEIYVVAGASDLSINTQITQKFVEAEDYEREQAFLQIIKSINEETQGNMKLLVFVDAKSQCEIIARAVKSRLGVDTYELSGNLTQQQRTYMFNCFKKAKQACLVATGVVERGIDVDDITHVINFQMPKRMEDYIHRIGRTARANNRGTSVTIFTYKDRFISRKLTKFLKKCGQEVPDFLQRLADSTPEDAYKDSRAKYSRYRH